MSVYNRTAVGTTAAAFCCLSTTLAEEATAAAAALLLLSEHVEIVFAQESGISHHCAALIKYEAAIYSNSSSQPLPKSRVVGTSI